MPVRRSMVKMLTITRKTSCLLFLLFLLYLTWNERSIYLVLYSYLLKCHKLIRQSKNLDICSLCLVAWNPLSLSYIPTIYVHVRLISGWFIHIFQLGCLYTPHTFFFRERRVSHYWETSLIIKPSRKRTVKDPKQKSYPVLS